MKVRMPVVLRRVIPDQRLQVIGIYDKGKAGAVMEREVVLVEKRSGEVYTKIVGSVFFVGCGNFGGPKGTFGPSLVAW
jgi:hypothetical protein